MSSSLVSRKTGRIIPRSKIDYNLNSLANNILPHQPPGTLMWNLKFAIWNGDRHPGFSAPRIAEVTIAASVKTIAATKVKLSAATKPAAFSVVSAATFTPV